MFVSYSSDSSDSCLKNQPRRSLTLVIENHKIFAISKYAIKNSSTCIEKVSTRSSVQVSLMVTLGKDPKISIVFSYKFFSISPTAYDTNTKRIPNIV